ncbi:MAG TPA: DUF397 domain-containing protein [Actinocrinis sp.]|uniref:DUF397 domain-containing protein n=1 Tax=Actinocrinis sp. TaxID=1920516 RepID=UPI002DDD9700|nr:DUF397 domain-containing protein [Actinocrinis sp.]HEV3172352.1 DUF397 domain-containing protein [Actinocrinis sp.]
MEQTDKDAVAGLVDTLVWRKSSHSNPSGNCVELTQVPGVGIAMRNSRDPHGAVLLFAPAEVAAFVRGAKDGHFDDLGLAQPGRG